MHLPDCPFTCNFLPVFSLFVSKICGWRRSHTPSISIVPMNETAGIELGCMIVAVDRIEGSYPRCSIEVKFLPVKLLTNINAVNVPNANKLYV